MNPFDPKAVFLARHAQHVVLIHFPIALFLTGVLFDLIARWRKNEVLNAVAYYNLLAAAIMSVPTLATGLLAWQWQLEGQRLKGVLLLHLVGGVVSVVLIWIVWWVQYRARRHSSGKRFAYPLAIEVVAALVIILTAHFGGFLSGVNGPS